MRLLFLVILLVFIGGRAQHIEPKTNDSLSIQLFKRGIRNVNKCTPWHHLQCVYITATEVYKDGSEGRSTRHWWRMSYIGSACTAQYGTTFGQIFEGFFAIPHYVGIGIGNGIGFMVYQLRDSPDKIQARKQMRKQRKLLREAERTIVKSE